MMDRRTFIGTCAGSLLAVRCIAEAQQPPKIARVGYLMNGAPGSPEARAFLDAFRQGLRERGYVEGQNILIEYRAADGKIERLPGLASELARLNLDVIVAGATPAARAAKQATGTIPIVAVSVGDPVGDELVASLGSPGGNVTGNTFLGPELVAKRLQLFRDAVPDFSRLAAIWHPGAYGERTMQSFLKETEATARKLGIELQLVQALYAAEFENAFSAMVRWNADALIVLPSPMLFAEHRRIVELAAKNRLPAMYQAREFVDAGGLMSYGANLAYLNRRAASYVDKILKGTKPADLPVEQPTKFEFVINLKAAKQIGLTIPPNVLARADKVIK